MNTPEERKKWGFVTKFRVLPRDFGKLGNGKNVIELEEVVVATGGGVVIDPRNRRLMADSGVVICLEAKPETILKRLQAAQVRAASETVRPLLAGTDPLARIADLKEHRQAYYGMADWTVHTDHLTLSRVGQEVLRGRRIIEEARRKAPPADKRPASADDAAYTVKTKTATYQGYVGWGIRQDLGRRMTEAGLAGTAYLVADRSVHQRYGAIVESSMREAGFEVEPYLLEPGEATKSHATAESLYAWLAERRAERGHVIVALGGGMAGDMAGYVAATYLRGMPFVQVPTTLLAMVDASIGGKVAVNLPAGKNLVGSFYQPRLVLADVETLSTLPDRERTAGWAEVIKHALILDRVLFHNMDVMREDLLALNPAITTEVIKRSAAIKARVVSQDERETGGARMLLNYGHTLGHALESALGYEGLLHGEAVAIGMTAAASMSNRLGMLTDEAVRQQRDMLEAFGLPTRLAQVKGAPKVDQAVVREAMALDKKVVKGRINWVLLEEIGRTVVRTDVPDDVVDAALAEVLGG
ncbi:MAG: 3-dehydroquinate synthase [Chloroflexi bacterium]|nr:3-dehydroquinate synthase [Chloroflexota bacterium]